MPRPSADRGPRVSPVIARIYAAARRAWQADLSVHGTLAATHRSYGPRVTTGHRAAAGHARRYRARGIRVAARAEVRWLPHARGQARQGRAAAQPPVQGLDGELSIDRRGDREAAVRAHRDGRR